MNILEDPEADVFESIESKSSYFRKVQNISVYSYNFCKVREYSC